MCLGCSPYPDVNSAVNVGMQVSEGILKPKVPRYACKKGRSIKEDFNSAFFYLYFFFPIMKLEEIIFNII